MALTMSRASVSFDRQAVAPNESIWLHSAGGGPVGEHHDARVGDAPGAARSTSAGARSVPKLSSTTAGECSRRRPPRARRIGTSRATSSRFGSSEIRTSSPTATRSSNFPATTVGMARPSELPSHPGVTPSGQNLCYYAAASSATLRCTSSVDTTCLPMPSSLGSRPSARPDHLRQVQDRDAEVALHELLRGRLLQVEVQVAERAGRDEAVGAGVDRVGQVAAGLAQRGGAVHRDHREAAALARARVLDGLAAERLDQLARGSASRSGCSSKPSRFEGRTM